MTPPSYFKICRRGDGVSEYTQIFLTIAGSVLASSGFWAYITKKSDKSTCMTQMLIGLGHDRVVYLGMKYLERGDWITQDEYENLYEYLYKPYAKLGGNGSAERIMDEVKRRLRIVKQPPSMGVSDET